MGFFGESVRRLWYLLNRRRLERDLQREMEIHRAQMAEPRGFGNTLRLREESNDAWGWRWLDEACRDLRFAARTLRQSPGFTIGASLVLALGIGLNLTLFQIYNATFLQPLNVRDIETLVRFERLSNRGRSRTVPYPATQHVRANNTVLSAVLVAARYRDIQWNDFENRLTAQFVSANWFAETGYNATAGRLFHETVDDAPDAQPAVVIKESFWTNRLNSDPNIVGSSVRINNLPATVVGILPKGYRGLSDDESEVFLPIRQMGYFFPGVTFETAWDASGSVDMYGRLKPGVPLAAARDSLRFVMDELAVQHPDHVRQGDWLEPYSAVTRFETPSQRQQRVLAVTGVSFLSLLVLTVACANLGNFVLSRAIGRLRELSIRIALGAGRWRVMRLLLAESALIAGIAATIGLALSSVAFRVMNAAGLPLNVTIDWRTILAAVAVASFAMIAIGLLPTWAISRGNIGSVIKDGGQTVSSGLGRTRLRSLLTTVQVGGSCIFLIFAGMTAQSLQRLLTPGFDFERIAVLEVSSLAGRNIDQNSYWTGVRTNVASMSETEDLALVLYPPLSGFTSIWTNPPEAPHLSILVNSVEPQFFNVMRVPIVAGRNFELGDDPQNSAIISRRLAMNVYGTLNVVGQQLPRTPGPNDKKTWTIVGVAEDAHAIQFEPNAAEIYFPLDLHQTKRAWLIARARNEGRLLLGPMKEAAQTVDKNVPVQARLMSSDFRQKQNEAATLSSITLSLALATLVLACIGVFGVVSYGTSLRRKEISIRLALGAKNRSLVALLMRQSGSPAAIGVLCGLGIAFAASKVLEAQRVYLGSLDAPLLLSVVAVIGVTCGVAALLPSVRALRTDVAQTLRDE